MARSLRSQVIMVYGNWGLWRPLCPPSPPLAHVSAAVSFKVMDGVGVDGLQRSIHPAEVRSLVSSEEKMEESERDRDKSYELVIMAGNWQTGQSFGKTLYLQGEGEHERSKSWDGAEKQTPKS